MQAIEEFKKGKVEYRADKTGIVHLRFGKAGFSEEDLIVNFLAAVVGFQIYTIFFSLELRRASVHANTIEATFYSVQKSVETNKPSGAKGVYWKSAHVCSSMGPSIRLNIRDMLEYKLT